MRQQLGRYTGALVAIAVIVVLAVVAGGYILTQQRLRAPWEKRYTVKAAFRTVSGVAPGLGEAVNVAGVKVGQINGAELHGGQGVLRLQIDPKKLRHVYADARAVLVPNTPLKDMQVDIQPGGPPARPLPDGGTIPVGRTTAPIDSDELLRALDVDTRTWLSSLIANLDIGTRRRGPDMRALLRTLGPTTAQAREIGDLLAARRGEIRRVTHNLSVLTRAAGAKSREIGQVVDAGNAALGALASEDAALRRSVGSLPGTLATARRTLHHTTQFTRILRPTLESLMPTARRLKPALEETQGFFEGVAVLPIRRVPEFTKAVLPLARALHPLSRDLAAQTPLLTAGFNVLHEVTDELAYNPPGPDEGYLFWTAWFAHNVDSALSVEDAHGAVIRGLGLVSCSTLTQPVTAGGLPLNQLLGQLLSLPIANCKR